MEFLQSSKTNKEEVTLKIAERDGITKGLICVLECVEPCASYEVHASRERKRLELQPHRVGENSIKAYDKQGSVLRVETTINDPAGFKVFRTKENKRRRLGARVSRKLRELRAHGLIHKISRSYRYRLSERGRPFATAMLAAHDLSLEQINRAAA